MRRAITTLILVLFVSHAFSLRPAIAAEEWKQEWEKTVAAANREGEVVIYGPHNPMYRPLWETFEKAYPGVRINFVPDKGSEHTQRILAERRAGKYLVDVVMGGSSTYRTYPHNSLEPIRPQLLLPEVKDESVWWEKKFTTPISTRVF